MSRAATDVSGVGSPRPAVAEQARWPALDGLRAVAVYLVVAFHAGLGPVEGGFIGVDVFFVLSGFLITRLLVVEHDRHGRLDLPAFYARRARRLLPAAWVAIIATAAVYVLVSTPFERETVVRDARASVFYVANWNFIDRSQDYFAESISSSPFLHLWSLAVEEQFYVVWPLCMLGLLALRRRSPRLVIGLAAAAAIAGAAWALRVADDDLLRAYYGTDTRAYQLLFGAIIAFVITSRSFRWPAVFVRIGASWAVAVGLVGIVSTATVLDLDPVDRGVVAAVATVVTIVGATAPTDAVPITSRLLGSRPLTWLGQRSYATYLWHWPLVIGLERVFVIGPRLMGIVVAIVATGLAHLSLDVVERPVRGRSGRAGRREDLATVVTAVAATIVIGTVVVASVLRADVAPLRAADRVGFVTDTGGTEGQLATAPIATAPEPVATSTPDPGREDGSEPAPPTSMAADERATPETAAPRPDEAAPAPTSSVPDTTPSRDDELPQLEVPDDLGAVPIDSPFSEKDGCRNEVPATLDECIVVDGAAGDRVLLVGDSHAARLKIAFAEHAAATDGSFIAFTMNGCPWQDGLLYVDALPLEAAKQFCRDQRDLLYDEMLDEFDPDVVILASHDQTTPGYAVQARPERGIDPELTGVDLIRTATLRTLETVGDAGRRVVIIEPLPNSPFHAVNCLSAAELIDDCSFAVPAWPHLETPTYRELAAERDDLITADASTLVCPGFPICRPIVDGIQVRTDADHLYEGFVFTIGPDLVRLAGLG